MQMGTSVCRCRLKVLQLLIPSVSTFAFSFVYIFAALWIVLIVGVDELVKVRTWSSWSG